MATYTYIRCTTSSDVMTCPSASFSAPKPGPSHLPRSCGTPRKRLSKPSRQSGFPKTAVRCCPKCGCQFSVTPGTIFASRKLSIRDYLAAIAIFANGAKGYSALQLSRDLDSQYKTTFVLAHKFREAIAAQDKGVTDSGDVEVDGMYAGGYGRWLDNGI